jgi:hypothetical protein
VIVVVIAVVVMIVMAVAAVDMFFGSGTQADQHVQRQATAAGFDDLHRRRQFFGDFGARGPGLRRDQVGLVDHQVGAGQLVGEQFMQRRFVVQVRVELALGVDLVREGGEGAGGHGRAVDHGDHRIDGAGVADFRPLEGLHQGLGRARPRFR